MALAPSTRLGPYEILAPIGAGGMGEVYRAADTKLGRHVAIKVIPESFVGDADRMARFEREAQVLAALNHPHIAAIYGLEESDGVRGLVMELVEGVQLHGPLPLPKAIEYAGQILDALDAAHQKGITHRDLKPANILVTKQGIKLLDFGLAKQSGPMHEADATLTAALTSRGQIVGTLQYMSPEQLQGKEADPRSDLFSFGCVLYEMLTGKRAFEGQSPASVIAAILEREPIPLQVSPSLERVVHRCLAKDRDQRFQTARDLKAALGWALEQPPASTVVQAKRGRWIAALAAMLVLGGLGGWIVSRWHKPPRNGHFTAITNFAGVEAQPSFSPDARSVAFTSDRGGQFDIWVSLIGAGSLVRITNDGNVKLRPRWSPDGSRIAYARLNESGLPDIWVVPALGGTPRRLLTEAADPAWSPDSKLLVYANRATNTIWMADANGGNPRSLTKEDDPTRLHVQPAFSRDGKQVAFFRRTGGPYGELEIADVSSGKFRSLTDRYALVLSPAWSPDDRWIYFASSRGGTVNIWKVAATGGSPEQITTGQGDDADLDVSADGKRIVFSTYRLNVNLAEFSLAGNSMAGRNAPKWLTTDAARAELAPAFSPDGRRIAYFSNRKGAENEGIWIVDADGSNPIQVVDDERVNVFPRWTADGLSLVYGSHFRSTQFELRHVSASGGRPETLVSTGITPDSWGGVAPDGRVAFRGPDRSISVFDPKSKQTRALEGIKGLLPRWSPDGRQITYFVTARRQDDPQAGLWIYDFATAPRQLFRGWVVWYAWSAVGDIFVLEGKPNLNGPIWRVRPDGSPPSRTSVVVKLTYPYWQPNPLNRFDVYPDGRSLVAEALEVNDADIGMIENVQ